VNHLLQVFDLRIESVHDAIEFLPAQPQQDMRIAIDFKSWLIKSESLRIGFS
jgi:hypothetical protein